MPTARQMITAKTIDLTNRLRDTIRIDHAAAIVNGQARTTAREPDNQVAAKTIDNIEPDARVKLAEARIDWIEKIREDAAELYGILHPGRVARTTD